MNKFAFEVVFDDGASDSDFPEDSTLAELGIVVGNDYLTLHKRRARLVHGGERFSKTVYGQMAGLADWFIDNWSYLLWETQTPFKRVKTHAPDRAKPVVPGAKEAVEQWENYLSEGDLGYDYLYHAGMVPALERMADWQHRHLVGHAISNLAIPSIVVVPENETVLIFVDRLPRGGIPFYGPDNAVRTPTQYAISKKDFRSTVAGFVECVIDRARSIENHSQWAEWMANRWKDALAFESRPATQLELMIGPVGANRVEDLKKRDPATALGLRQLLLLRTARSTGPRTKGRSVPWLLTFACCPSDLCPSSL